MGKQPFLSVLAFTVVALLLGIYLSSFKATQTTSEQMSASTISDSSGKNFPWKITQLASGQTRVFGLTIGQSTLQDAEQLFKEKSEITLFMLNKKEAVIEGFFNEVKIAGLKAKMIMSMTLSTNELQNMFKRGARIATLGSGTRKVTLSSADALKVRQSVINGITYLPSVQLNEKVIEKRFGQPDEKIPDTESDAIHWLYQSKGVDIALSANDKEVIQYVEPEHFAALIAPLKNKNVADKP